ncbi:DNA adenine methylase [Lactiplantibacillus plantarum]|uniref:DNA adenine methylase n=2 Tax=Lactiplantibacillus plantarum TaxID=1590 RepID=UPI000469A990|nr:DNA adenine methylase [Lactiplantibacillus plantarum]ANI95811.1 DNA methyltransferase [Lactiplantibacillus plantarum]APD01652.1 DNA adenine methylase [Lactiplantibacillus plantarum]AYG27283.1 DNA adenine methylase [Lactiplantibacillus plantarum]MBO2709130.1 Dam family site-specific DNA-(adenine-N6)-methyltransferase [Lactiplantibacillus plantarum]MBP5817911.1 DNA adenine methylase [Lactiplantibacillus plantarum]
MVKYKNPLVKPFVKWAGGKRQLIPQITKYMPKNFGRYFEPFVGGGAVFFNLQHTPSTINDFNTELILSYEVIRDNLDDLLDELRIHEANNSSEYYYKVREWDRNGIIDGKSDVERAARFIFLNKTGFNGLFRVNRQNQVNTPYGRYKHPAIVNAEILKAVSVFLNKSRIKILNVDFEKAVKDAKYGDFVYFDPPYAPMVNDKQSFVGYTLNGFGADEQVRLRDLMDDLTQKGVKVMLSNSSVPFIHDIYSDYSKNTIIVPASRNINSKGNGRGKVNEVLIMNYNYLEES